MPFKFYSGWVRDTHDPRDIHYSVSPHVLAALPTSEDLESLWGGKDVYNQEALGSCGPNAAAGDILAAYLPHGQNVLPSRLFIYYITRLLQGTVNQDSGVSNRTMLKALSQSGWCDESLWPYTISQFTQKPSDAAFQQALPRKVSAYVRVPQSLEQMKGALAQNDPFIFGFVCYESLMSSETARTGIIPFPKASEKTIGGHDIVFCGYDDAKGMFKLRNSWGPKWGLNGYGWFPYEYALDANKAGDFWTLRFPGDSPPPQPPPAPSFDFCQLWHTVRPFATGVEAWLPANWKAVADKIVGALDGACP